MEKTISTNQTSLILIIFTVALKFSVLPSFIFNIASKSSTVVTLIAVAIDFLLTLFIILIMQKVPEKSFFELIKDTLSKTVAIIIYTLMFIYFFFKLLISLLELHDYYIVTLFERLNPFFFILTLSFLMLFMFSLNFRAVGRMIEILFWPLALGIFFTLIYPLAEVELVNLLPIMEDGSYPIYLALLRSSFAYGDFMVLFVLMGKISYSKKATKKILLYLSTILGFVFNFYVIFVGTFGNTSVNQSLALSELPMHNPYPTTIGRLEWLTIIMWTTILIIQVSILGLCCTNCMKEIFGLRDKKIPSIVIIILLIVLYVPTYLKLEQMLKLITSLPFVWCSNSIELLCFTILLISYLLIKKKSKKNNFDIENTKYKWGAKC